MPVGLVKVPLLVGLRLFQMSLGSHNKLLHVGG